VDVWNDNFWIGFSNRVDYSRNIDHYLQPLAPVSSNSTYYTVGFGSNMVPSIALGVFDASTISVNELTDQSINIYPNPANKFITIEGAAAESELQIIDLSSRTVASQIIESSLESIDLSEIKSGHYFMKFTSKGGSVRTVKFSKL
jgi:hypothetical protein